MFPKGKDTRPWGHQHTCPGGCVPEHMLGLPGKATFYLNFRRDGGDSNFDSPMRQ